MYTDHLSIKHIYIVKLYNLVCCTERRSELWTVWRSLWSEISSMVGLFTHWPRFSPSTTSHSGIGWGTSLVGSGGGGNIFAWSNFLSSFISQNNAPRLYYIIYSKVRVPRTPENAWRRSAVCQEPGNSTGTGFIMLSVQCRYKETVHS